MGLLGRGAEGIRRVHRLPRPAYTDRRAALFALRGDRLAPGLPALAQRFGNGGAVRSRWASTGWIWRKSSLSPRSAISVRARSCNESACARRAASSIRAYPSVIHFAHTACTVFRRWTIGRSGLQATEPRPNTLPPTTWSWSCPSCCSPCYCSLLPASPMRRTGQLPVCSNARGRGTLVIESVATGQRFVHNDERAGTAFPQRPRSRC